MYNQPGPSLHSEVQWYTDRAEKKIIISFWTLVEHLVLDQVNEGEKIYCVRIKNIFQGASK